MMRWYSVRSRVLKKDVTESLDARENVAKENKSLSVLRVARRSSIEQGSRRTPNAAFFCIG